MSIDPRRWSVCPGADLGEGDWTKRTILFEGRREECLIFRFEGRAYAYLNRCVHMPRALDCEKDMIFDRSGRHLRCSMHGIIYAPENGASLSVMCEGQRLRRVALVEEDGEVCFADHRVAPLGA